jgi:uncharacterized MnhB-related membrane protein
MQLTEIARIILLLLLIVCAIGVNFGKSLLQAVIIFMSYSSIMCILWVLLESPDLAITEAAVGAGVSSVLFMLTLRRIHTEDLRLEALEQEARKADAAKAHAAKPEAWKAQVGKAPEQTEAGKAQSGKAPEQTKPEKDKNGASAIDMADKTGDAT